MLHRRKDQATCWDVHPVEKESKGWSPDGTVHVDIRGSNGHQCAEFKLKFPDMQFYRIFRSNRDGLVNTGSKGMVHDMFMPQPIKGIVSYLF